MKWTNRLGSWLTVGGAWSATVLTLGIATAACLSRPVGQQPPTTKVNSRWSHPPLTTAVWRLRSACRISTAASG